MIFCGFRSVAVNSVYELQFFTFITVDVGTQPQHIPMWSVV